jgi:hypothetical protein
MTKKESITLSMSLEDKIELEKQAKAQGFYYGKKVNISGYIRAFVRGEIKPNKEAIALIQEGLEKLK